MNHALASLIVAFVPASESPAEAPYPYTTYRYEHRISPGSTWQTISLPDPYGHYTPIAVAMPEAPTAYALNKGEYQLVACGSTARVKFRKGRAFVNYRKQCNCRAQRVRKPGISIRALFPRLRCKASVSVQVNQSCGHSATNISVDVKKPELAPAPDVDAPAPEEPES